MRKLCEEQVFCHVLGSVLCDAEEEEHMCQLRLLFPKSVMEMRGCMRVHVSACEVKQKSAIDISVQMHRPALTVLNMPA